MSTTDETASLEQVIFNFKVTSLDGRLNLPEILSSNLNASALFPLFAMDFNAILIEA